MIVVVVGDHVVVHDLLRGGAGEREQQRAGKARPVLALDAVDEAGGLVPGHLEERVGEGLGKRVGTVVCVHGEQQHVPLPVKRIVVFGGEALRLGIARVFLLVVRKIQHEPYALLACKRIRICGAAVLVVAGGGGAEERAGLKRPAPDLAEIGEDRVGIEIGALVGILQRVKLLHVDVFALFVKGDGHLRGLGHAELLPGARAVVPGDHGMGVTGISAEQQLADGHVVARIVGHARKANAVVEGDIHAVAEGEAEAVEAIDRRLDIDVAEFLVVRDADLAGGELFIAPPAAGERRRGHDNGKYDRNRFS